MSSWVQAKILMAVSSGVLLLILLFVCPLSSFRLFDEQKDVLILVFLEDIPSYQLSPYYRMRKLLKKKSYLSWPRAGEHTNLFWEKLRQALKTSEHPEDDKFQLTVVDRPWLWGTYKPLCEVHWTFFLFEHLIPPLLARDKISCSYWPKLNWKYTKLWLGISDIVIRLVSMCLSRSLPVTPLMGRWSHKDS